MAVSRTTRECTYRTVGTVCRPFTPIRKLFAHDSHSRTPFARSHTIRTLFAGSHTIRTFAHYSHGRTLFAHYSRHRHTARFARWGDCTLLAPVHTPVTLFARWGEPVRTQTHPRSISLRAVRTLRICGCAICTVVLKLKSEYRGVWPELHARCEPPQPVMRTTLENECTYRTVGNVRRHITPIRTLFAHYSHSRRIVFTAILTLFTHYSHGRTLFARSHTVRTVTHYSHTIRTVAHYSHGRTLFAHYSRGSHTIRAIVTPNLHTIRTSSDPGHTIRAVGEGEPVRSVRTHSHSIRTVHTPFAFVNVRYVHSSLGL